MKQGHVALLFFVILLYCFTSLWKEQKRYDEVLLEKQRVEYALERTVEYTAQMLSEVLFKSLSVKQSVAEKAFFEALRGSLGVGQEVYPLNLYIPLMALVEENGCCFYSVKEVQTEQGTELIGSWSEEILFSFPENCTEIEKESVRCDLLEDKVTQIIDSHNCIAKQFGLHYVFSVPEFFSDTEKGAGFPRFIVVFQGWPLDTWSGIRYANCLDAGVYLQKEEKYVVEMPRTLQHTFCYYHMDSCDRLTENDRNLRTEYYTKTEAVENFGAIPCENCIQK